jgi:hypothetical protein
VAEAQLEAAVVSGRERIGAIEAILASFGLDM